MNPPRPHSRLHDAADLAAIVGEASTCVEQLSVVLDREREALQKGDVSAIDSCGQEKSVCVTRLEELERERVDMCQTLTIIDSDLDDFLTAGGADEYSWQAFLHQLQRCREANSINGQITQLRRRHVERALHILRGGDGNDTALYGPNGLDKVANATELGQA